MEINYLLGDATSPISNGNKIICHISNDIGGWGRGFVLAISNKWKEPEKEYRSLSNTDLVLGNVQFVDVEDDIIVANMIAQRDVKANSMGVPPVRYAALDVCLKKVADMAMVKNASIHMPRIGCGLGGGHWELIEPIIRFRLTNNDIHVYVYDF